MSATSDARDEAVRFHLCFILAVCAAAVGCQTVYQLKVVDDGGVVVDAAHTGATPSDVEVVCRIIDDFAKEHGFVINSRVIPSTNTWKSYQLIDQHHAHRVPKIFLSVGRPPGAMFISITILDEPPEAHSRLAWSLTKKLKERLVGEFGARRVRMERKGVYDPTWLGQLPKTNNLEETATAQILVVEL